jgi:hypothetical protein
LKKQKLLSAIALTLLVSSSVAAAPPANEPRDPKTWVLVKVGKFLKAFGITTHDNQPIVPRP